MPPSQLKRLKSSLREQGIVGPQKSKKQKKQAGKTGSLRDNRIQKGAALQEIREHFNPFEVRGPSRSKYDFVSNKNVAAKVGKGATSRPGVTKGLGEENRRRTLLVEMQRRKKIGGIMDRRFGENDPTMTPEEKALQRFVKEKERGSKKGSLFDLEDGEDGAGLTHAGRSLFLGNSRGLDDFDGANSEDSGEDGIAELYEERPAKRRKMSDVGFSEESSPSTADAAKFEHPKTKKEVMEEIIAKSKLHKHERQQAKEDDDELRARLDKEIPDLTALLRGTPQILSRPPQSSLPPDAGMNPDRLALLNGKDRSQADKEYDERLREMALDQRAKPTLRTLTQEEKLYQEAQRLKELEAKRLRRMRGELDDSDSDAGMGSRELDADDDLNLEEENTFGLGSGLLGENRNSELGVEDEDDFIIEDDLVTNASDIDASDLELEAQSGESSNGDEEAEFVQGLLSKEDAGRNELSFSKDTDGVSKANDPSGTLAYTYSCPQSHDELLSVLEDIPIEDLPTVIQRIRALYHPKLDSGNKDKLGKFATVLVDHISYLANQSTHPPFAVLEAVIRHIHSLAKMFPEDIGRVFRSHLKAMHGERPSNMTPGDLIILTAIASIFPTSDHFHQVVTPAMLCMSRYLGQKLPKTLSDLVMGTYITTLCLQYQRLSKRYIPEVVNFIFNTLWALAPVKPRQVSGAYPHHVLDDNLQIRRLSRGASPTKPLTFWDILPPETSEDDDNERIQNSLFKAQLDLVEAMTVMWSGQSSFCEIFASMEEVLHFLKRKICLSKLDNQTQEKLQTVSAQVHTQLQQSLSARKPLRLHNHRPLAIKTSIPKFEESYNPDKHYDPDRERAAMSKVRVEHKRERKGALRELRKDANFVARESLREKKERDSAYEKKYKRLVAEIQGEEGREAKTYEREKRLRKGRK